MKSETMLISAKYDIGMTMMVFAISVALLLKSSDQYSNIFSAMTIISCLAYFGQASRLLNMEINSVHYTLSKQIADTLNVLTRVLVLFQISFYLFVINYAN